MSLKFRTLHLICSGENENDFLWPRGVRSLPALQEDRGDHDPTLLFIDRISTHPKSRTDVMSQPTTALEGVEALVFDAFGTVTNWEDSISREVQSRALEFTREWRAGYLRDTYASLNFQ